MGYIPVIQMFDKGRRGPTCTLFRAGKQETFKPGKALKEGEEEVRKWPEKGGMTLGVA